MATSPPAEFGPDLVCMSTVTVVMDEHCWVVSTLHCATNPGTLELCKRLMQDLLSISRTV